MNPSASRDGHEKWTSPERRGSPRFPVNVPASVTIVSIHGELQSGESGARIVDVCSTGGGLRAMFETEATSDEIFFVLSGECKLTVECTFPGSDESSRFSGDVVWYQAIPSASGMTVRLGVSLRDTSSAEMEGIWTFLARLERRHDSE